jgi:PAS domain S-box-containing protein
MSDTIKAKANMRRRMTRLALLLLALVPIIANAVVAFRSLDELRDANARVARALQAILLVQQAEDLVVASGQDYQLYRLFGGEERLTSYRKAMLEWPAMQAKLRGLVAEGAVQSSRLDRLSSLIEQNNAILATSLAPPPPSANVAPLQPELEATIQRLHAIMSVIDDLQENENSLLDARLAVVASRNTLTFETVVIGVAGGLVLIGVIFTLMRRDLRRIEQLAVTTSGALQKSEQLFRSIFDESPIGIVLAELDGGHIVEASPAFCRMVGYRTEEMDGRDLLDIVHVDDRELLIGAIEQARRPGHGGSEVLDGTEIRQVTRSGAIAWARIRLSQLSGSGGRKALLLLLIGDITREKRVEAELRQAQKMEAIGQLTGGIAHDFNNLLGIIIGNAEFLIDAVHHKDEAGLAKEILNSALSGADLTRRLLAFARRQTLQPRRIDLNGYLPNHVAVVRRLLGESITITTSLADDLWPTRADASQVGDALLNLAINARDAMPHGGTISIATANARLARGTPDEEVKSGDYVMLSVTDTGIGMGHEVLERAIEPFFTTKAPGAGSGLGLSMIFGFAKQSGGHLRIDSELGRGTRVRLYLPRAHSVEAVEAEDATAATLPHGKELILLVDDDAEMRTVARRHLVSLGYRVGEAGSGPAALEILQADKAFDLLFTDVVMPDGMTGHQLAAAARQLRPGLKVLFTTGYFRPDPDNELTGAMTADAMIRKPYRRTELAATVRATLEA